MLLKKQMRQLQTALVHQKEGRYSDAVKLCNRILREAPADFDCVCLSAVLYAQLGDLNAAAERFRRASQIKPDDLNALYNLAVALSMAGNFDEAARTYAEVLKREPRHANARNNYAACLLSTGRFADALQQYDQLIALNANGADAHNNRGMALQHLQRLDEAVASFDKAIALRPNFPESYVNRGNALAALNRFDDALASYNKAVALRPDFADAYRNIGNFHFNRRAYSEAIVAFERAASLRADDLDARSMHLSAKLHQCDWSNLDNELSALLAAMSASTQPAAAAGAGSAPTTGKSASPSVMARLTDDPAILLASSVAWLREHAGSPTLFTRVRGPRSGKLRLGYLSQDFRQHVTGLNWVEMFEKHDRSRFELFGFSVAPDDGSAIGKRIAAAFDEFHDLSAVDDAAAARFIHDRKIDVLVEMVPHSFGSRPAILAHRPAPVQVNGWSMGYSAGATFFDYIVADEWMVPFDQQPFFVEKIVHLPHTCFAHDSTQAISARTPTRAECGLPDDGFVFCAFNASYKIFPQFFAVWMRLLRDVPNSVLWLTRYNDIAIANLQRAAANAGIDPARLVFAGRLAAMEDHLARHRQADLFLGTLPYNAQVTAMDALWAGLPVLNCTGRSYAGRIGTSQLHGIGLPELAADSLADYERLARALAHNPAQLKELRIKLENNRLTMPLFDTKRLCREIEAAYTMMVEIWQRGESPRSFSVKM